ncbi:16S rRNA (guanine(966)-N(2))-methyltransferase RsmD [Gemmatimonas sp.]|jgi:16S rRNA (guanine966-N2)-methyltransferase|uniref:16S rRNA (guanine(966)-N(2))-methyltransferase RsmD n=1 Tax=Gemmatimonas sp. TaxID=1962908 RepID=UPI0022C9E7E2|nr:16S rRNA (guanine(966)-N(2))-methyltransferase RsmD [Gemmatimonas sp.]MCZ8205639.1 16S rRNA (guanine(966)-N(2))-methyltransferase RsmD [Gemmatimonas sp.]
MRIIAGRWKGRRLAAPPGDLVRPTADRVREAWMSMVHPLLPDARVLDLCSGSGALGLESLSRGAAHCDFVEQAPRALKVLQANLDALGGHSGAVIHRGEAVHFVEHLRPGSYDVAFADPPYASDTARRLAEQWLAVPFAAVFAVEHSSSVALPTMGETRRYGTTALTFFRLDS